MAVDEKAFARAVRDGRCYAHDGREHDYQAEAAHRFYVENSIQPSTWEWISTTCATPLCLNPEHMAFKAPKKLAYPSYICIYCGRSGHTVDHLLPRWFGGEAKRAYVVTVPACGTCNSLLGDTLTWSITERRSICHARLRRKFRKVLNHVEYGPTDLKAFGPILRKAVIQGMQDKAEVMRMLDWPIDPLYDDRACEKAGISDPYEIGLIISRVEADRIAAEVTAPRRRERMQKLAS